MSCPGPSGFSNSHVRESDSDDCHEWRTSVPFSIDSGVTDLQAFTGSIRLLDA